MYMYVPGLEQRIILNGLEAEHTVGVLDNDLTTRLLVRDRI